MLDGLLIATVTQASTFDKEKILVQSKCRRRIYEFSVENDQIAKLMSSTISYKKTDSLRMN